MSLVEALTDEAKKKDIVRDCCDLIDAEVKDKGGISGLAIKAGYGTVKGIKPGFVESWTFWAIFGVIALLWASAIAVLMRRPTR